MRKLIILAFFAAGLQWAVAQNTGYSLAVLSSKACVAAAGAKWLVLDFNALPRPQRTHNCVGSYTIDMFTYPRVEPILEMIGIINPYNMRFGDEGDDVHISDYTYCVPVLLPVVINNK